MRNDGEGIYGLADLTARERNRVHEANDLAAWMVWAVTLCIACKVPVVVENPATSRLWLFPPLKELLLNS